MQKSLYIIEGVDGVGKTTIVKELANRLHALSGQHPVVIHCTGPCTWSDDKNGFQYEQYLRLVEDIIPAVIDKSDIILDRSHVGEGVYGVIHRGAKPEYLRRLDTSIIEEVERHLLVLLAAADVNSLRDDGNNIDKSKLVDEAALFMDYFNSTQLQKRLVHTTFIGPDGLSHFRNYQSIIAEILGDPWLDAISGGAPVPSCNDPAAEYAKHMGTKRLVMSQILASAPA
jgi:hypothetical protein